MEYTMNMVDATYDMAQLDDYDVGDYSQLLEFLNSPNFRTFGEGLEQCYDHPVRVFSVSYCSPPLRHHYMLKRS